MSVLTQDRPTEVSKQAVQGSLWVFLSFASGKFLTFITSLILANLLLPAQYGLMASCLAAIEYLDIFNNFGTGSALVSRRDKLEEAANAGFVISLLSSLMLFTLGWFAAPIVARFFKDEAITELFRVLILVLPLTALGSVPGALLNRRLRFKAKLIPNIAANFVKGALSVTLALLGFGVWSLIWGQLGGAVVSRICLWYLEPWRPTWKFDHQVTREMLSFGVHIILISLAGVVMVNVDYLIVGRVLGSVALGYYILAYRFPQLLIASINGVVATVAYPLLAQLQSDARQLRSVYVGYLRYISFFLFPTGVGFALIAPLFVRLFIPRWEPAIVVMQLISVKVVIGSLGFVPGVLYKAINRPQILNQLAVVKVPYTIGILWIGTRWGIEGVAFGHLVVSILNTTLDSVVASRILNFRLNDTVRAIAPACIASIVMALAVSGGTPLLAPLHDAVKLVLFIIIGAGSYLAMLMFISREEVERAGKTLRSALTRA